MDVMLLSRLGQLKIVCSLPLFSDAICLKSQSAAEHGFTQVVLSILLAPQLGLTVEQECELVELSIFAEMPKAYLGDPSFYLRKRHPEMQKFYGQVRGRLWKECEGSLGLKTSRCSQLYGIHEVLDAFAAMLFIEKECLLGNQYFETERYRSHYHKVRRNAYEGEDLSKTHPATMPEDFTEGEQKIEIEWKRVVGFLDELFEESTRARLEGGLGEYSSTVLGMIEKLKEHYRYKGWSYLFKESVGEHTFQVIFVARLIANKLKLSPREKLELYRICALHDLAEAYASDVIYPVKIREKDLAEMHSRLEEDILQEECRRLGVDLTSDARLAAIAEICDRFSAQIYFDREARAGNTLFKLEECSIGPTRKKYEKKYPEVFAFLDEIWDEYLSKFEEN